MSTITTRSSKGSALTFTEMDNNFTNLNTDKLENVSADTTPQLGGSLDVNGNKIVSVSNGNIDIEPNGTGNVLLGNFTFDADQTVGSGQDNYVLTYDHSAGTISLEAAAAAGLNNVSDDTTPQLGGDLDVNGNNIVTTSNGNIILAPNGTGLTYISNGIISLGDYGASGYGVITGTTSKGFAAFTNAGAQGAGDPQFALTNGGGASLSSGSGALSLNGASATFNGINVNNLQLDDYKETIYTGGSTTGTITPDVANGNVQAITLTGSITFSAFSNAEAGQSMTLIVTQPSSGGPYTLTSTMKFAGGTKTLSTGASDVDIISVFYDGTNYFASLATDFS